MGETQQRYRDCTCVGHCRGADGLAPGWRCQLKESARLAETDEERDEERVPMAHLSRRAKTFSVAFLDGKWSWLCARCDAKSQGVFGRVFVTDDFETFVGALKAHAKAMHNDEVPR